MEDEKINTPEDNIDNINEQPAYVPPEQRVENAEQLDPASEAIAAADSFDALYDVLDELGSIQGTQMDYDAGMLKRAIQGVRNGVSDLNIVTRTNGLRRKVSELLNPSPVAPAETPSEVSDPESIVQPEDPAVHQGYPGAGRFEEKIPLDRQ